MSGNFVSLWMAPSKRSTLPFSVSISPGKLTTPNGRARRGERPGPLGRVGKIAAVLREAAGAVGAFDESVHQEVADGPVAVLGQVDAVERQRRTVFFLEQLPSGAIKVDERDLVVGRQF